MDGGTWRRMEITRCAAIKPTYELSTSLRFFLSSKLLRSFSLSAAITLVMVAY